MEDSKFRKRSLGGSRTNPTLQAAGATAALRRMQEFLDRDEREIVHVTPRDIRKRFNARFIPCSLEEFAIIEWPELSVSVDEAKELFPSLLSDRQFWLELNENEKEDFIEFLAGVHSTAVSMVENLQIHPVTLERESTEAQEFFIVDGERRSLSALYSRGRIPLVKAYVYNRILTPLERARLKDIANTAVPLSVYETILSKCEIYKVFEGARDLPLRELGQLLGYKKDAAALLKGVFEYPDFDDLMRRIKKERLGWRDIKQILRDGFPDGLGVAEKNSSNVASLSNGSTKKAGGNADVDRLAERISEFVGFPCAISHNKGNGKVKVTFRTTLDDFENLFESLHRVDVQKVFEQ